MVIAYATLKTLKKSARISNTAPDSWSYHRAREGDSVYSICFCYGEGDTITEWTVVDIFLLSSKEEGNSVGIRLKDECIFISISPCELGNRYFLTKEEAEQALKGRENNG